MNYDITYTPTFLDDINTHKKRGNKKLLNKISQLEKDIEQHPRSGIGKVERLKHYKEREIYSRRIDREHRLVYEILEDDTIVILMAALGHY